MSTRPIPDDLAELGEFVRDLRALDMPAASDALQERILRGMPLPVPAATISRPESPARGARSLIGWRVGLLAAGLSAVATIRLWGPRADIAAASRTARTETPAEPSTPTTTAAAAPLSPLAQLLSPFPTLAYAQSPSAAKQQPYPPASGVDARRLRSGLRTYIRLSANDYHDFIPDSHFESTLEKVSLRGQEVWRMATSKAASRRLRAEKEQPVGYRIADTTWFDVQTMRPVQRRLHAGVMTVQQQFTATERVDTIRMSLPKAMRRTTARTLADGPFGSRYPLDSLRPLVLTEEGLRVLLRTLPLQDGWRGSIAIPAQQGGKLELGGGPLLVNLRVAGADTVQLFSGRFACWRVVIELGAKPAVYFVSQETGETLITDGPDGLAYPESKTFLMYGLEETKQLPSIRRR